ncbi:MAG TPA: type II CAAX endopeptidase family protein, partial [Longimicrobiaceae bacterium]|nr:type II CAAX endopeptidase family protein [Longimicrobiaceae bacterium]
APGPGRDGIPPRPRPSARRGPKGASLVNAPDRRGLPARVWGATWRIIGFALLVAAFGIVGSFPARALPEGEIPWVGTAVSLAAALAASWVMMVGVERRPFGAVGLAPSRVAIRELVVGTGIGAGLLALAVILQALTRHVGWIPDAGTPGGYLRFAAWTLAFFALAAALEEVLFRGYPFQVLVRAVGAWPAMLLSALLFAAVHAGNPNVRPLGLANICLAGVLLSVAYLRTRSLWFATAIHLGWNWTMSTLLDLPVSGLDWDTPLYTGVETGPDWWTGGAFGPEAGVTGALVLAAGTAWLLRTGRLVVASEVLALRPLVDDPPAEAPPDGPSSGEAPSARGDG